MRVALLALLILYGCSPPEDHRQNGMVLPYNGDPDNFTAGGYPRHVYPVRNCDYELKLKAPFEVSEDGWGNADIRVPLELLDNSSTLQVAADGSMAQDRVSFVFPSRFQGEGMKEWFASKVKAGIASEPLPLKLAGTTLGTKATMKGNGTSGDTRYLGKLPGGREVALDCDATDWPNSTCRAELPIGSKGHRYLIIFPPKVSNKLTRMVQIGDDLFSAAAKHCGPPSHIAPSPAIKAPS